MTGEPIAIFYGTYQRKPRRRAGWYWDTLEDHGGFDRVSPEGPFADYDAAEQDAIDILGTRGISKFVYEVPSHYPEDWTLEVR